MNIDPIPECNTSHERANMRTEKLQLQPAGTGFVVAKANDGLPPMRRLVKAYTSIDKKAYIKLDGKISPLLPSHKFIAGN